MKSKYLIMAVMLAMAGSATAQGTGAKSTASSEYMSENKKMMDKMGSMKMTGDADKDFAMMMTSHHQGAVDMANIELKHGKDPKMKAMAQKIIDTQPKEIKDMQDWLNTQKK